MDESRISLKSNEINITKKRIEKSLQLLNNAESELEKYNKEKERLQNEIEELVGKE